MEKSLLDGQITPLQGNMVYEFSEVHSSPLTCPQTQLYSSHWQEITDVRACYKANFKKNTSCNKSWFHSQRVDIFVLTVLYIILLIKINTKYILANMFTHIYFQKLVCPVYPFLILTSIQSLTWGF